MDDDDNGFGGGFEGENGDNKSLKEVLTGGPVSICIDFICKTKSKRSNV